jgi:hypothetical protein
MLNTPLKYEIYRQVLIFLIFTSLVAPIALALTWLPWAVKGIAWYQYMLGGIGAVAADLIKHQPWVNPRKEFLDAKRRQG